MIRDQHRLDRLLAATRSFVRDVAIPNEDRTDIEASRALILETARKFDRGDDVTLDVSMCKYHATEMCGRVADRVVQIFGGQGYVKGRGIERFSRDVRPLRIYEGTSQIHLLNIGKRLVGPA